MKPKLLKISLSPTQTFNARRDSGAYFFNEWHFHPELELVYITKGAGTQFIGDNIQHFKPGDLILAGSELPHLWRCENKYFEKKSSLKVESYVLHFLPECFGKDFFNLPENVPINKLLEKAKQGLQIHGKTKAAVAQKIKKILEQSGTERIILLLEILSVLSKSKEVKLISSKNYSSFFSQKESERLNNIYQYILTNFHNEIKLTSLAKIANISPQSFCRYFKSRTKKTFSRFLLDVRVSHACKLLSESDIPVSDICFESGFNSFSNFNKYFKQITNFTPLNYRKYKTTLYN